MLSNKHNFCGGNYDDWLEVFLTDKCNGGCNWCVEKQGYHPIQRVSTSVLVQSILRTGKQNIILLGGEPTLYPGLGQLVSKLRRKVNLFITTNGSMLTSDFVLDKLNGICGLNVSIHHYNLIKNQTITGIKLAQEQIEWSIWACRKLDVTVRFNCNVITGHIDSWRKIDKYIEWARATGADKVRFAELKQSNQFVDLNKIFKGRYGLNADPYIYGCNQDVVIRNMPVNFRQMCGLQTNQRPYPISPKCVGEKQVLYYNGVVYNNWQRKDNETIERKDATENQRTQKADRGTQKETCRGG